KKDIAEIFLTDKLGGLAAASRKTTDFYQADEFWWKEAYNNGKGGLYIGELSFDDSSGVWGITIAAPVKDRNNNIIGVCKAVIDTNILFSPLNKLEIGKTGHADLIDKEGNVIFHEKQVFFDKKYFSDKEIKKIVGNPGKWMLITNEVFHGNKEIFVVSSLVDSPVLLQKGIEWFVLLEIAKQEALAPLGAYLLQGIWLLLIVLIFIMIGGYIFGGLFVKSIRKLHEGTERIGKGDLDFRVDIKTDDEIEQLADSFNKMTDDLKNTTISIDALNLEVSQRKKIEEELFKLAAIVESSEDAIIGKTLEGIIISWNKGAERIYGYTQDEVKGKNISIIIPPDRLNEITEILKKIKQGEKVEHFETLRLRKDKKIIPVSISLSPMYDLRGRITGASAIARDITKEKKTEEQLKELLEIKTKFTAIVSHELRTPLSSIREGINLVIEGLSGPVNEQQKHILDVSKKNVERLNRLVNDLLNFQKLESKKAEFNIKENDLNELMKEVYESMKGLIEKKGLDFNLKVDENLPRIKFDKDRINEVFVNFINNAIKFTEKGAIDIIVTAEKNAIHVIARDTGVGIKEEDKNKLFQPFEQVGKRPIIKGGTGLGLAICKDIINGHNGKIWVESEFGQGSTFHFTLPI
ncbi:MAG: PAS domain S-box protein, partial [Candidatus Omnitrophota bacterium]